jgi:hypothetical protein
MKTELLSFIYLYGVGGAIFLASLCLLLRRSALDLRTGHGRHILAYLFVGYGAYFAFHTITQFILPGMGVTH